MILKNLNLNISDDIIEVMNDKDYNTIIKNRVREEAIIEFKNMQAGHIKGYTIYHEDLKNPHYTSKQTGSTIIRSVYYST